MKIYPNGVSPTTSDDAVHAWTPDPASGAHDLRRARCGARLEAEPFRGMFDPHDDGSCAPCSSLVLSERMPSVRR